MQLIGTELQCGFLDMAKEAECCVDDAETHAWKRGEFGGHKIGFYQTMKLLEGIQPALYLVAGQTNQGKTAMLTKLGWDLGTLNDDSLYVRYYSMDDSTRKVVPRLAAMNMGIPISAVEKPKLHQENSYYMRKREEGLRLLKNQTHNFCVVGEDTLGGTHFEQIVEDIQRTRQALEEYRLLTGIEKKLVVCIDSLYNLTSTNFKYSNDEGSRLKYIVNSMKGLINQYGVPILCTAELKKLGGMRRPTLEDVRETCEIAFRADAIILIYSEVGIGLPNPRIYHLDPDNPNLKLPIVEAHFAKNKTSDFKGRMFFKLFPASSTLVEATRAEAERFVMSMAG